MRNSQLIRSLGKSIQNSNITDSIKLCNDETNTRVRIIHPFLELLGYKQLVDYTHEYVADISGKKGTKVDIAITFGKKKPLGYS